MLVDFTFKYKYFYSTKNRCLKTDKAGIIHLGRLKDMEYISAYPRSSRIISATKKTWSLPQKTMLNYPSMLTVLDTEPLKLPFQHKELKTSNFQLVQMTSRGTYIENRFDKAKLVKNQRNQFGVNYIEMVGLEEGQYQVWLKKEDVRIMI